MKTLFWIVVFVVLVVLGSQMLMPILSALGSNGCNVTAC